MRTEQGGACLDAEGLPHDGGVPLIPTPYWTALCLEFVILVGVVMGSVKMSRLKLNSASAEAVTGLHWVITTKLDTS